METDGELSSVLKWTKDRHSITNTFIHLQCNSHARIRGLIIHRFWRNKMILNLNYKGGIKYSNWLRKPSKQKLILKEKTEVTFRSTIFNIIGHHWRHQHQWRQRTSLTSSDINNERLAYLDSFDECLYFFRAEQTSREVSLDSCWHTVEFRLHGGIQGLWNGW